MQIMIKIKGLVAAIVLLVAFNQHANGQMCQCSKAFYQTKIAIENNYAGWFDKVNFDNVKDYLEYSEVYKLKTQQISSDSLCAVEIANWLAYFKDKQLAVFYQNPNSLMNISKSIGVSGSNNKARSEEEIMTYLKEQKKPDEIEGIYSNDTYTLGVIRTGDQTFHATVIHAANGLWKQGEVKMVFEKTQKNYAATLYNEQKNGSSRHVAKLVDNILDVEGIILEKTFPKPKKTRDRAAYERSADKQAPSVTIDDEKAVLVLPSFSSNSRQQLKGLLEKNEDDLKKATTWVIDLRNNGTGSSETGMDLMPYLYSKPYVSYHEAIRMTSQNFDLWYQTYGAAEYEKLSDNDKNKWTAELDSMKAYYGRNYNRAGRPVDTITMAEVKPYPRKVAILIDGTTAGGAEMFVQWAAQSDKVIVMGENSAGKLDYGHLVRFNPHCTSISLQMPIGRYLWLDAGYSVDKFGIKPAIKLSGKDWVEQAFNQLDRK